MVEPARAEQTREAPRDDGNHRRWSRSPVAVAAASLIYLAVAFSIGRFPVTDEVFFKSAGRQWAAGAGFGAPELAGALGDVSPPVTEVFFLHPPAYPFLFGLWTRLLGFGPHQCVMFDATIHVALIWLVFGLGWRLLSDLGPARRWLAAGVAIAILPIGTAGRPDELAMCFGTFSCFLLLATSVGTVDCLLAGIVLGLCLGTSTGAAIAAGLIALTIVARIRDGLTATIRRCLLVGAGAAVGVALAIGPILVAHPSAPRQYLAHARYLMNDLAGARPWAEAGAIGVKYYVFTLGALGAGLLAAALVGTRRAWRLWAGYGLGASLYLIFLGIFLALRNRYTWFIGPWLLIAAAHLIYVLAATRGKGLRLLLPVAALGVAYLTFAVHFVKETLVIATLPSAQRGGAAAARLEAVIPAGATVLTKDLWWFLAERNRIYEPMFLHPSEGAIDYVALTGNGSGVPGVPSQLDPKTWGPSFTRRMTEVANDLPRHPTRFLGMRITNSAYGFGSIVYRVRPAPP